MSINRLTSDIVKLIQAGATTADIEAFLDEEGVTVSQSRAFISQFGKQMVAYSDELKAAVAQMQSDNQKAIAAVKTLADGVKADIADNRKSIAKDLAASREVMLVAVKQQVERLMEDDGPEDDGPDVEEIMLTELKQQVAAQQKEIAGLKEMLGKLLTAQRVPVRDKAGNLVGVKLEVKA